MGVFNDFIWYSFYNVGYYRYGDKEFCYIVEDEGSGFDVGVFKLFLYLFFEICYRF